MRTNLKLVQCAILAIRPLVFFLVQKKLEMSRSDHPPKVLSEPVRALLQTCVDSATASLDILSALHEQSLIGKLITVWP